MERRAEPIFLRIRPGDHVAVRGLHPSSPASDWWIGAVLHCDGGARGPQPSLCQVACIDTGIIHTVNADQIVDRLRPGPGDAQSRPSPPGNLREQAEARGS
ncbi:hypothetical protein CWE17_05465 [Synechococcus sp. BS56D]|uniref:DUF3104 domain-containing protein n=1 Tax=unclassified Synechococcus TaxID=2626047 RepID=UPI0010405C18|nr:MULTISPECIES: DUF3104 domain-containing protein [unclassified Synechococcus]NDD44782.1 DUF3104 domain-containing protein [Synechococcaceae bacterium WB9_4xB_025]TCD57164.1 hypothetical protein CWE16_05165 [Synechococcus sp. BS55D]TCD58542.1 hypothetical protein CWE17_05465 [Synechococcus sp. BS56D]